jgi:hypothetical protein
MRRVHMAITEAVGIPQVHWSGTEGNYNILVMELLGPSLEILFKSNSKPFSVKCSIMLAEQMVIHCLPVDIQNRIHTQQRFHT